MTKQTKILAFNLLNEEMGLDISCVREVLRSQEIHPLPQSPDFIEGVINLRDYIITVMDLRKKFNLKISENHDKTRIIICKIKKFIIGLMVDSVNEVVNLSRENIQAAPEAISANTRDGALYGIARIDDRVIMLLDLENILSQKEIKELSSVKSQVSP